MIVRINIGVADVRAEPTHNSERVSQGLLNEAVETSLEQDGFTRVRFSDGYEGWMAAQFLSDSDETDGDGPFIVNSNIVPAFDYPDNTSRHLCYIPYGCQVYGEFVRGFLAAKTTRWGTVFIHQTHLIAKSSIAPPANAELGEIQNEAEKFLGAPYLWGGRSFFGIDCSGFVKAIMARFGQELPRDTKDQIKVGIEVGRDDICGGDLLFFPRHVALALSGELFIHSSRFNGGVSYNSLNRESPQYNPGLAQTLVAVKRILA